MKSRHSGNQGIAARSRIARRRSADSDSSESDSSRDSVQEQQRRDQVEVNIENLLQETRIQFADFRREVTTSYVQDDRNKIAEKEKGSELGHLPALARLSDVHRSSHAEPTFSSPQSPSPLLRRGPFAVDSGQDSRERNAGPIHSVSVGNADGRVKLKTGASTDLPDLTANAVPMRDFTRSSGAGRPSDATSPGRRRRGTNTGSTQSSAQAYDTRSQTPEVVRTASSQSATPSQKNGWRQSQEPWGGAWPSKLQGNIRPLLDDIPVNFSE